MWRSGGECAVGGSCRCRCRPRGVAARARCRESPSARPRFETAAPSAPAPPPASRRRPAESMTNRGAAARWPPPRGQAGHAAARAASALRTADDARTLIVLLRCPLTKRNKKSNCFLERILERYYCIYRMPALRERLQDPFRRGLAHVRVCDSALGGAAAVARVPVPVPDQRGSRLGARHLCLQDAAAAQGLSDGVGRGAGQGAADGGRD
eukprot:scaffold35411_cov101-Isochrysis_galbana.AAC.1